MHRNFDAISAHFAIDCIKKPKATNGVSNVIFLIFDFGYFMNLCNLQRLIKRLESCDLCPNRCGINRWNGETGVCGITAQPAIYQHFVHVGEEITLIPSFIINMAGCSLSCPTCPERCRFDGRLPITTPQKYAAALQRHFDKTQMPKSIQWIGGEPSCQIHFVLETSLYLKSGLSTCPPIYLNTNGYFDINLLDDMEGIIDGFVFDLKCEKGCFEITGHTQDYFDVVTEVIKKAGTRFPSIIIRHLVMPGHVHCCTENIVLWCRQNMPQATFNLMTGFQDFRSEAEVQSLCTEEKEKAIQILAQTKMEHCLLDGHEM